MRFLLAVLLLFSTPVVAGAATFDPRFAEWVKVLQDVQFSGVVSVREKGKTVFEYAGNGGRSGTKPIRRDDVFFIGSVSKQFAAVAVLKLVAEGKIDLHQPVSAYLPLPPNALTRDGKTCTVEHLLSGTCGLPQGSTRCDDLDLEKPEQRSRFLQCVGSQSLAFTPGEQHLYSNMGFGLAGVLVSVVSGQKYDDFLFHTFFEPLNMLSTGSQFNEVTDARRRLARAELYLGPWALPAAKWTGLDPEGPSRNGASGNLFSTVDDLHRWNNALHGGQVLPAKLYEALITPRHDHYGLGIVTKQSGTQSWLWHNGGLTPMGWSSHLAFVPASKLSIVVLTNRGPSLSRMDDVGFGMAETALATKPAALEPLKPKAYFIEGVFALMPGLACVLTALLVFFCIRGPRKGALVWFGALASTSGGIVLAVQALDFYRAHVWVSAVPAFIVLVFVGWHRRTWLPGFLDVTTRRQQLRSALPQLFMLVVFIVVMQGLYRLGFVGALALWVLAATGLGFWARRTDPVPL